MFHLKRLVRVKHAANPDAWACIAEYPSLLIAASRLCAKYQDDDEPETMDDAYDPSIWLIEEWDTDGFVEAWRVERDFDVVEAAVPY